jgi:glutamate 5-kinase
MRTGREVVIVSSGAVAAGRALLHATPQPACAMAERGRRWLRWAGEVDGVLAGLLRASPVAQVLLTHDDLRNRRRYLNARATLQELLRCGALPIVNENDTVSVDELKLGDNDTLGAIVAALIDADVLFIATDIDGSLRSPIRARMPMRAADGAWRRSRRRASRDGRWRGQRRVGTGGMRTKILAARSARGGRHRHRPVQRHARGGVAGAWRDGRLLGTRLSPAAVASPRASTGCGMRRSEAGAAIVIDAGAARARSATRARRCCRSASPTRAANSAVATWSRSLCVARQRSRTHVARGVTQYSAADIRRIARRHVRTRSIRHPRLQLRRQHRPSRRSVAARARTRTRPPMSDSSMSAVRALACRDAAQTVAALSTDAKNADCCGRWPMRSTPMPTAILAANAEDLRAAEAKGIGSAMLDRLKLDPQRLAGIAAAVREVADCPIRSGQITRRETRPNGIESNACACRWV